MGDHEILVLVDSGSSTTFINKTLADTISGAIPLQTPCKVQVADGSTQRCTSYIPKCAWTSSGHAFLTDMKILALGSYDAILGMDWLEAHNPDIDWVEKTQKIQSSKGPVVLTGHKTATIQCSAISSQELTSICKAGAAAHLIHVYALDGEVQIEEIVREDIQRVLAQFSEVFEEPTSLPPRRSCDHRIPLMPGAQPVNLRAYRHKPELKSEIDRQVQELLQSGIIQKSTSQTGENVSAAVSQIQQSRTS